MLYLTFDHRVLHYTALKNTQGLTNNPCFIQKKFESI